MLARHRGRAALVSSSSASRSCQLARRLANAHGHARLDWVLLLAPVAADEISCWRSLAMTVQVDQPGHPSLTVGQRLASSGLSVAVLTERGRPMLLRAGDQRWLLFPGRQSLWALRDRLSGAAYRAVSGSWLTFHPTRSEQRWLERFKAGRGLSSRMNGRSRALGEVAESG